MRTIEIFSDRTGFLSAETEPHTCVFCEIIKGKEEGSIITRDDEKKVIAFMDLQGYPLVCPIEHIQGTIEAIEQNNDTISAMYDLSLKIIPTVYSAYGNDGLNVFMNIGKSAGMEIDHLHIHLIPRFKNEKRSVFLRKNDLQRNILDQRALELKSLLGNQK